MHNLIITVIFISIQFMLFVNANTADALAQVTNKQAKALQSLDDVQDKEHQAFIKTISIKASKLSDNQGQEYIGALVNQADLLVYLKQLEAILGKSFSQYRERQAVRDHQQFHMTLVSPPEYQHADKSVIDHLLLTDAKHFNVTLLGLGKVALEDKETFFIVAHSNEAQRLRQQLLLKNKDFHITLGFNPSDIYGVTKDITTLIAQ